MFHQSKYFGYFLSFSIKLCNSLEWIFNLELDWHCLGMLFLGRNQILCPRYNSLSSNGHQEARLNNVRLPLYKQNSNVLKITHSYLPTYIFEIPFHYHLQLHFYRRIIFVRHLPLYIDIHTRNCTKFKKIS